MITDISRCSPKTNPWGSDTSCPPEYNGSSTKDLYFLKRCHLFIYLYRYCVCFFPYILTDRQQNAPNIRHHKILVFLVFCRQSSIYYCHFHNPPRFKSLSLSQMVFGSLFFSAFHSADREGDRKQPGTARFRTAPGFIAFLIQLTAQNFPPPTFLPPPPPLEPEAVFWGLRLRSRVR